MKVKKASIVGFLLALLLMAGNSCSDDNPYLSNENGSVLETTKDFKLSSFPLERHIWEIPETTTLITIQLRSHTDFTVIEFDATVSIKDEKLWLCIRIPKDVHIPDSDYDVWGILADGKKLGARLVATFKNEMLHSVMSTTVEYGLAEGDGTAENPYIINTADDFNTFAFGLYKDSLTHGANLYFKQGADFTAPPLRKNTPAGIIQAIPLPGHTTETDIKSYSTTRVPTPRGTRTSGCSKSYVTERPSRT